MILIRCISFLIGGLIVTGAPFFLLPDAPPRPSDFGHAIGACLVVALLASGFFLIGVAGNHMKRSRKTRWLAGVLLAFPIVGSLVALASDSQPEEVWMVGPLLCGAIFLFFTFVFPARRRRTHRPLRPRDPSAIPTSQN